ncbi:hypothetical protein DMENIID0001_120150 [Sergentomyia squamirostris]
MVVCFGWIEIQKALGVLYIDGQPASVCGSRCHALKLSSRLMRGCRAVEGENASFCVAAHQPTHLSDVSLLCHQWTMTLDET